MSEAPAELEEVGELSPGAMLARARSERRLSVADIAEHLKYAVRQIEALEADNYVRLPGTTIVRGMIRGYARLLEMDPAPVLQALERRNIPAHAVVDLRTQRIPFPDRNKRATRLYSALSIIVLLAIVAVMYEWHLVPPPPSPLASAPAARPAPAAPPVAQAETRGTAMTAAPAIPVKIEEPATPDASLEPATPVLSEAPAAPEAVPAANEAPAIPDGHRRIEFEFQRESWVEIRDRAGKRLTSQVNPPGTRKVVEGEPPFSVVIGNAAHVRVIYRDAPVDLKPHSKGDVARLTLE